MLQYPHLDPIAVSLGPLKVHWYGLMYLVGFLGGWLLGCYRAKKPGSGWTTEEVSDLVFYCALGVVLGGRIGYMLFYDLPNFIHNPLIMFKIWDGGMSFHGGMLGVLLAMWLFSYKTKKAFFQLTDFIAPLVPIGLGAGRIGNFINGELWGRITNVPWGMVYPNPMAGPYPRHPSEIYEFLLEGVLLFIILWFYSAKPKPRMAVSALFLVCYGSFRFFAEFFRQPDAQLGYYFGGTTTMGQILCFIMFLAGASFYLFCKYKNRPALVSVKPSNKSNPKKSQKKQSRRK